MSLQLLLSSMFNPVCSSLCMPVSETEKTVIYSIMNVTFGFKRAIRFRAVRSV